MAASSSGHQAKRARLDESRDDTFEEIDDGFSSDDFLEDAYQNTKHDHALLLLRHMQSLYALGKITAKDLCIGAFHAYYAGLESAGFERYMLDPSSQTGKFQNKLDIVAPPPSMVI